MTVKAEEQESLSETVPLKNILHFYFLISEVLHSSSLSKMADKQDLNKNNTSRHGIEGEKHFKCSP